VLDVSKLDPKPPGFGRCRLCSYRDVDRAAGAESWAICYACASREMEGLSEEHCDVCGQETEENGCPNYVCGWGLANRGFSRVYPIAKRTGMLKGAISAYKYESQTGWAQIFGRVLVGYLDAHADNFDSFDWIISVPTYVGLGGRSFDHTWKILEVADLESYGRWPFANDIVVKTGPTQPFTGHGWKDRRAIAEGELRETMSVPDPTKVKGKRILVFDDVFTDGFTMREVARLLRSDGAIEVAGVVLARQPY
jgi:predicted amidophosphoribosyltransferase